MFDADITQLADLKFTEYATKQIYYDFYSALSEKVKVNEKTMNRYKLSDVKPNPHYSI